MMILNLSKSLAKPLVMAKLNMAYLSSLKNRAKLLFVLIAGVKKLEQNCCCPHCRCQKTEQNCCCPHCRLSPSRVLRAPSTSACCPHCRCQKTEQNCCCPHCRCHHLGYSVLPAHHCTIWCRSTFGPRGPGLSNPTSFLRPALPMAPTTDNNARDKRSVLRPNPATFLRDFTLFKTTKYAILRKRCLNYNACLTHLCPTSYM